MARVPASAHPVASFIDVPCGVSEKVFEALPADAVGHMTRASRECKESVSAALRGGFLAARASDNLQMPRSLQDANVTEKAIFYDSMGQPDVWDAGPNTRSQGNDLESEIEDEQRRKWLSIRGGTDWQGFQGGFRHISTDGVRPSWLAFTVRTSTPALSGAFLAVSAGRHTWGLEDIVLTFQYRGDEGASAKRCFAITTRPAQKGGKPILLNNSVQEVLPDVPYDVAIHLDWVRMKTAVYINGTLEVANVKLEEVEPIRYVAMYNWRSGAKAAFSALSLGDARPQAAGAAATGSRRFYETRMVSRRGTAISKLAAPVNMVLFVLLLAISVQVLLSSCSAK